MTIQLRDYQVKAGEMEEWLAEWTASVRPLREQFGFRILGAWVLDSERRFIWILAHEDFESADDRYYRSPERRALQPDPARHLASAAQQYIRAV